MERGTPYSVIAVRANDDLRTGPTQTRAHAFSAAGLFYTGKELCISTAKNVLILQYTLTYLYILQGGLMK